MPVGIYQVHADEEGLGEDNGIYGWLACAAIARSSQMMNEGEIDGFGYLTEKVIYRNRNEIVQRELL